MKINFKNLLISSVIVVMWIGAFLYSWWYIWEQERQEEERKTMENFEYVVNYLKENYEWNYPYPKGDIKLYDEDFVQIHLEDRNKDIEDVNEVEYIKWNTCWLWIENEEYQENNYDVRYTIWENKRCFSYVVTKDQEDFQVGTFEETMDWERFALLEWTKDESITKSYDGVNMVKTEGVYLSYMPSYNNNLKLESKRGTWKLTVLEDGEKIIEENNYISENNGRVNNEEKESWLTFPKSDESVEELEFVFEWEDFTYRLIDPRWNTQLITPGNEGKAKITYEDFDIKTDSSEISVISEMWRIAYSLVRIGDDSEYEVKDSSGAAIAIRGTKFVTEEKDDTSIAYLHEGKINYQLDESQHSMDSDNNVLWADSEGQLQQLRDLMNKVDSLFSGAVVMDILLNIIEDTKLSETKEIDLEWESFEILDSYNDDLDFDYARKIENNLVELEALIFKWNISHDFAHEMMQERININNQIFDDLCQQNWYEWLLDLSWAFNILTLENISQEYWAKFTLRNGLDKLDKNYKFIFDNYTPQMWNITYFDNSSSFINYNVLEKDEESKWYVIVCKK